MRLRSMRISWHKGMSLIPWLLAACTETATVIPWLILFYSLSGTSDWAEAIPGAWLLIATYLAACLWEAGGPPERGHAAEWGRLIATGLGVTTAYALTFALLPAGEHRASILRPNPAMAFILPALYLWYQGTAAAAAGLSYTRLFAHFFWQCAALVAGIAALALAGQAREPQIGLLLYWSAPLLFAAGLGLLLLTRERQLRAGQAKIGQEGGPAPTGSAALLAAVLLLVGLTLLASQVLSLDRLSAWAGLLWRTLDPLLRWLIDLVILVMFRLGMLLYLLLGPLLRLIAQSRPQEQLVQSQDGTPAPDYGSSLQGPGLEAYMPYIRAAFLLALFAMLSLLLYRLYRRMAASERKDDEDEERISLGFWSSLAADQRAFLRLFRRRRPASPEGDFPEGIDPRSPRALFRRLQAYGAESGRPREPAETPNCYRDRLSAARAEAAPTAAAVTAVYNQARYGAAPPPEERVAAAAAGLAGLKDEKEDR